MKKQSDNISDMLNDIRRQMPETQLPNVLSSEAVEDLVAGVPQKKSKKKTVKRAIAGVLAACMAICGLFALDAAVYAPVIKPDADGRPAYSQDYTKLLAVIKDYRKSEKFKNSTNRFAGLYSKNGSVSGDVFYEMAEIAEDANISDGTNGTMKTENSVEYGSAAKHDNSDYSKTNTRVDGIGEADIVKTDGKYLYVVRGGKIYILKLLENGKTEKTAEFDPLEGIADTKTDEENSEGGVDFDDRIALYDEVAGDTVYFHSPMKRGVWSSIIGLYLQNDMICVEFSCYRGGKPQTGIAFYDVSSRAEPTRKNVFLQDGDSISSRAVGNSFILVSYTSVSDDAAVDDSVIPEVSRGGADAVKSEKIAADKIGVADTDEPTGFLIVSKIDTVNFESKPATVALLGGGREIYCTDSVLYIAADRYDDKEGKSVSKLMAFDITGDEPEFKAVGTFDGSALDTFSIDEYNGYVRVAASLGGHTCVYVLNSELKIVGKVDNIAPGESIMAVRFSGSTGYVVTFYQTDPLFVIDLSNPEAPAIVGELKIPGFSSYLHPVGENLLLGVGSGGTENGTDGSGKLSLFDVSDPKAPKEIDSIVYKDTDFNTEYKAFTADSEGDTFFVPYNAWTYKSVNDGYIHQTVSSMKTGIVRVAVENGKLVQKNIYEVERETEENAFYLQFDRAAFVGNTVYCVDCYGTGTVVSFDKSSQTLLDTFRFGEIY